MGGSGFDDTRGRKGIWLVMRGRKGIWVCQITNMPFILVLVDEWICVIFGNTGRQWRQFVLCCFCLGAAGAKTVLCTRAFCRRAVFRTL